TCRGEPRRRLRCRAALQRPNGRDGGGGGRLPAPEYRSRTALGRRCSRTATRVPIRPGGGGGAAAGIARADGCITDMPSLEQSIHLVSLWALPVIVAITFHEAAHAFAAWRLGDDTAYRLGRVTFN